MREFAGFVTVDGRCFTDNDEAIDHENQLIQNALYKLSASELLSILAGRAPHLDSQIRGELARYLDINSMGVE